MKMKPLLGAAVMVYDSALPTACTCTTRLDKQLTGWWSAASRAGRGSTELRSRGSKTARIFSQILN